MMELSLVSGLIEDAVPGKGEDTVCSVIGSECRTVLIACMDGCGGSGGKTYTLSDNSMRKGAWIASNEVKEAIKTFFITSGLSKEAMLPSDDRLKALAESLKTTIDDRLNTVSAELDRINPPSKVKSKLSSKLPTTLAMVIAQQERESVHAVTLWAGDSRTYILREDGLHQWSRDDISGNADAQNNLIQDGIMNNSIHAGGNYTINIREARIQSPCIFLTASDGCFSYFHSPIVFEGVLLNTLSVAETPKQWMALLKQEIGVCAQDDRSLQLAAFGFNSFQQIKDMLSKRKRDYERDFGQIKCGEADVEYHSWEKYRKNYESLLMQ